MKQSRLKGAISLVIAQAIVVVLGYVAHLWIGRVLGPGPYGIYGVVLSLQSILGLLLTLGIPVAVSRYVAQDEDHAHSTLTQGLRLQTVVALLVGLGTFAASGFLARALGDESLTNYIRFSAVVIMLQGYYPVFVQFLSGLHNFHQQASLTALYAVAKLAGALALIYWFGVYGAFAGFAIGGVVAALAGWAWSWSRGGRIVKIIPVRAFLNFAGTYVLILVGLQILISIDLFMVKALLHSDVQAGYYNAAVSLSRISYMLLQGLGFILLPSVSALTKPGLPHKNAAAFIAQSIRYMIMLIVPSVALASATSRPLITLFFSHEYVASAPILTILMVGIGCLAFYLLLTNIVAGAGKAKIGLVITLFLLAISVGLGLYLIPRYGLLGAAWQTTIAGGVGLALLGFYTFRSFGIPIPMRSTINVLVASAAAVAPTYMWQASALTLPLQYILIGCLYLLVLFLLGEITMQDRRYISTMHPALRWLAK